MPSVQIKDVPEQTHAVLRQRAAAAHQSLQEYLRARLIEEASEPTLEEVLDRAGGRSGGSVPMKTAVATLRADRAADPRRAALALADLAALPLRRAPHRPLLIRCWELRDNLTVYDASYVALAEVLDVTLLTGDGRLARAPGLRCHVETLRPATLSGASSFMPCRRQALARSAYSGCCVHDVSAEVPCA